VNLAGFILRKQAKINKYLSITSIILSFVALITLLAKNIKTNIVGVIVFVSAIVLAFIIEIVYRKFAQREIAYHLDTRLEKREKLINSWETWVPKIKEFVSERYPGSEVFLAGGLARGERESSSDVDLLIFVKDDESAVQLAEEILHKFQKYPIDVHIFRLNEKEEILKSIKKYIAL
jgi:predicted nucleotidyltransferase